MVFINDYVIEIPIELPTRNQEINATSENKYEGQKLRKKAVGDCQWNFKSLPDSIDPIKIRVEFYRADRQTDPDNIISAIKYVLDALEAEGVIDGDGWANIKPRMCFDWEKDEDDPRTVVRIMEVDENGRKRRRRERRPTD